jgi:hypothetical protein
MLFNKKGNQKFYGTIAPKPERYMSIVTEASASFSSRSSPYYIHPYVKIKSEEIAQGKCGRSCVLIISVYSTDKGGNEIEYSLEVTQNHVYLRENEVKKGFLAKGSMEFYEYECRQPNGSLIFKVSDNNRKCARSIMAKTPFPTGSNYLVKENEGTIIHEKTSRGSVYFSVEAVEDCPYWVTVSEETVRITKLDHG